MHFSRSDTQLHQTTSKASANNSAGRSGVSMPAVPVLQQKLVQKKEEEQQEQSEFDAQPLQLKKNISAGDGVVQREVENKKNDSTDLGTVADEFFTYVNGLAKQAYQFAVTVPSLGPYVGLDGHTELWKEKWDAHLAKQVVHLMSATFGYVVESLVSNPLGPFHPVAPTGYTIYYQVVVGGTRPDLVLRKTATGEDVAWVDLTAANSGGHIFLKDSWDKKVARYAEVTYPSLDSSTFAQMLENKDNTTSLSHEEFEKRKEEVKAAFAIKKANWVKLGENYKYSALGSEIGIAKMTLELNPKLKRDFIIARLKKDFGVDDINEQLVPSILAAMGVGTVPWGFTLGYSQSVKAGEAWLTDHDPTAETIAENKPVEKDTGEKKVEKMDVESEL